MCRIIVRVHSFGRNITDTCTQQSAITAHHTATLKAIIATTVARRTLATSEDRQSLIRQRCGGQAKSSLAENCSAPVSSDRIEDVHSFGSNITVTCTQQSVITAPHTATLPAIIATTVTRRTGATSEDRKSLIRQRCGCQKISGHAEIRSSPVSRRRIKDIHNFGCSRREYISSCTHYE